MLRISRFRHASISLMLAGASLAPALYAPAAAHDSHPEDFSESMLAKGGGELGEPMGMKVLPDLSVLHTSRRGELMRTDRNGNTIKIGQLSVYTNDEEGLQGIGVDPAFASNRRIYLFYAPNTAESVNRLSRFTLNADFTLNVASEQRILDVAATRGICCHVGGDIEFDADGNLYLSTGDDANPFNSDGYSPIDERPGREAFDAQRTSANTNDLRGKILRINVNEDGTYTIPNGNLFPVGMARTRPEIYAMGLRNPFRMSIDKPTGAIFVGDYGPDAGGYGNGRGPGGQVEFNRITGPGNYGWPYCTGTNTDAELYYEYDFATGVSGSKFDCAGGATNNSPNNTGLSTLPPAQPSWIRYGGDAGSPPEFGSGGESPMAGPVYRYDPANPSTTKFPQSLDAHFFAGEFSRGWIKTVDLTPGGGVGAIGTFKDDPNDNLIQVMDLEFGPDGALYVLDYGTGSFEPNENSKLLRFDHIGPDGNHAPHAEATGTPVHGLAPLTVNFSSAGSNDVDGDPITYAWNFGDGQTSTALNPSHTYTTNDTFKATLTVTDSNGASGSDDVIIGVGNTPPTVTVSQPLDGQLVSWGEVIPFAFTPTDAEDGSTPNCSRALMVNAVRHDTPPTSHTHELGRVDGCSGYIEVRDSNEGDAARLFPIFVASYTDSQGLPGTKTLTTQLRKRQAEHFDSSSGINPINKSAAEGGQTVGDIDNGDWISFSPYRLEKVTSFTARVSSAGVGGTVEIRAGSPTGLVLGSATVPVTGSWETFTTVTGAVSGAPNGTTTLYITFSGGFGKLFDLDSFEFNAAARITGLAGKCLDVQGGNTANGTQIQLWGCNGTPAQSWQRAGQTLKALGKCLDVNGRATHDGAKIQLWECNQTPAQDWVHRTDGSVMNPYSGKCLDVTDAGTADGTKVQLWTCSGGDSQKWSAL